jgi:hypothetical protein
MSFWAGDDNIICHRPSSVRKADARGRRKSLLEPSIAGLPKLFSQSTVTIPTASSYLADVNFQHQKKVCWLGNGPPLAGICHAYIVIVYYNDRYRGKIGEMVNVQ